MKDIKNGFLNIGLVLFIGLGSMQSIHGADVCGFQIEKQPNNPAMPYKITKKGNFISFVTIQDQGDKKVISIGGNYYTFTPKSGTFKYAEKTLPEKPKNEEEAVQAAYSNWAKEHCHYGD